MSDKIVVASSLSSFDDRDDVWDAIIDNYEPYSQPFMWDAEISMSDLRDADVLVGDFAREYGLDHSLLSPAWWSSADMFIGIGESQRVTDMAQIALSEGVETHVVIV